MKTKTLAPIGLLLAVFFLPINDTHADIFVYKDEQGKLHFTNLPTHGGFKLPEPSKAGKEVPPGAGEGQKLDAKEAEKTTKLFKMGETALVGYFAYEVTRAWWMAGDRDCDDHFLKRNPDHSFLFVELYVVNAAKTPSVLPPFRLVNKDGYEYDPAEGSRLAKDAFGILESLNPLTPKRGVVVFDWQLSEVEGAKLKVSGGFLSLARGLIEIKPEGARGYCEGKRRRYYYERQNIIRD
jgi:hypothetical protein